MRYTPGSDPDIVKIHDRNRALPLVGIPFLLAGLLVIALSLNIVETNGDQIPFSLGFIFGGVFALLGVILVLIRSSLHINSRRQLVEKSWGILWFKKTTTHSLLDFSELSLSKEIQRTNNSSRTIYPIRLQSDKSELKVTLRSPRNKIEARTLAEKISRQCKLPLVDASSGTEVHRNHDELDLSYRDLMKKKQELDTLPAAPTDPLCKVSELGSKVQIDLPATGIQSLHKLIVFVLLIFGLIEIPVLLGFLLVKNISLLSIVFALLSVLPPLLIVGAWIFLSATSKTSVEASSSGLKIISSNSLRRKTEEFQNSDLEELNLLTKTVVLESKNSSFQEASKALGSEIKVNSWISSFLDRWVGIEAASDRKRVHFARYIPDDELIYLHAIITKALLS